MTTTDLGKRINKHNNTSELHISLTADEALVLFEFLSCFKESSELTIVDQAEVWVLSNLLGPLQDQLVSPFQQDYVEQLQQARNRCGTISRNPTCPLWLQAV